MCHHFRRREDDGLVFGFIAAAGQLRSFHECFYEHFLGFFKGLNNGRLYLFFRLNLCYAEARTAQTRLDETRQTDLFHHVFVGNRLPLTQQQRFCNTHSEGFQVLVAGKLVIGDRRSQHSATRVWYVHHVKVSLKTAVFARSTVNGNIGKVKLNLLRSQHKAEIVTVYRRFCTIRQLYFPTGPLHLNNVQCVLFLIYEGIYSLCTTQGYMKFGGVTSGYDSNCAFHSISLLLI